MLGQAFKASKTLSQSKDFQAAEEGTRLFNTSLNEKCNHSTSSPALFLHNLILGMGWQTWNEKATSNIYIFGVFEGLSAANLLNL